MANLIQIDQIQSEIEETLKTYSDEVIEDTKKTVDEVTEETLKIVKTNAPVGSRKKYKKSLKAKTAFENLTEKRNVIYAANGEHRLVHLLEKGHKTVNGKKTKAQPHFEKGQDYVDQNFERKLKNKLGG